MSKRILITGGAGFLGSHLCDRLVEQGHSILCLDNCFTGSKNNVQHLLNHKNFKFIQHDVIDPLDAKVEDKESIDEIYNLACPASPVHYQHDPIKTMKTSFFGAFHMLGLAKKSKAKILQASTSEVYGDPQVHPQNESYWGHVNCIGYRSCYDEGKRAAETLFMDYHRQHQLRIKIIRIFNTYGPRMHPQDGRVVSNFIIQALKNENITVYGEGNQTRSFCFADDLVDGIIKTMNSRDEFIGPVNLGNPGEFKIIELAKIVIDMIGSKSKIIHLPLPPDDPNQRKPDISLARKELKWEPAIDLRTGLKKTISYFEERLKNG